MILHRHHGFWPVVVATGHLTDGPRRAAPRFPESAVGAVEGQIESQLRAWAVGEGALVICGGARGGDLLAARVARRLGATVWVLLARPPEEFVASSVAGTTDAWVSEFWSLLARVPSWTLEAEASEGRTGDVYARANQWMLEVAEVQADGPVYALAVWDGEVAVAGGGTADMVARADDRGAELGVVDPLS